MENEENDIQESEIQKMTHKCDNLIYSISFISPNYPSNLINFQKDNINEITFQSKNDENPIYDLNLLLKYKINKIIRAKAIKGQLWYYVELSNGVISFIPNDLADRFISDDDMIKFLLSQIKNNKNNTIPRLLKSDIANNPHLSLFQLPYSLSKNSIIALSHQDKADREINESNQPNEEEANIDDYEPNNTKQIDLSKPQQQLKKTKSKSKNTELINNSPIKSQSLTSNDPVETTMLTRSKEKINKSPSKDIPNQKKKSKTKTKKSK